MGLRVLQGVGHVAVAVIYGLCEANLPHPAYPQPLH